MKTIILMAIITMLASCASNESSARQAFNAFAELCNQKSITSQLTNSAGIQTFTATCEVMK